MEPKAFLEAPNFKTPEEEIQFLRGQLAERERTLSGQGIEHTPEQVAAEVIQAYKEIPHTAVLSQEMHIPEKEAEAIVLVLKPETHDVVIEELLGNLVTHGIKNTMTMVEKMNNPHIMDDFHRFLVQYLVVEKTIPGLDKKMEMWKGLNMALYEVTLPAPSAEKMQSFGKIAQLMEQFYAGMQSIASDFSNNEEEYFSLELALGNQTDEMVFYVCVPRRKADLFEKQVLGIFTNARVIEITDDYNIFTDQGAVAGAYATPRNKDFFPLHLSEGDDNDPLSVLLSVFSKLERQGEGTAVQIIVRPAGDTYIKQYRTIIERLRKGEKLADVLNELAGMGKYFLGENKQFLKTAGSILFGKDSGNEEKDAKKKEERMRTNEEIIELINEKVKTTIVETNIRVLASAQTLSRAEDIVQDVASAFNQFNDTKGNGISFKSLTGRDVEDLVSDFSFRLWNKKHMFHLNLKELAALYHFPQVIGAPQLKEAKAGVAPAPLDIGTEGILLGANIYRGLTKEIHFLPQDRLRHFYAVGQTGVGKTQFFLKMIIQDIQNGEGCCYVDPHGSDINTILANIPYDRIDDVVYFDPSHIARPMGLNMMEFDERFPQQKSLVVSEMMSIFEKLFDMKAQGGAMFGQYFRNSALLNMEDPESGNTMLEITRVLSDPEFRAMKLSRCKNPIIREFWRTAEQTTGDQSLANFVPYISSKFDDFISNEFMRPIVLQQKSAFNFRKLMDEKKILLVNLSKGLLGEKNASLIGLVLVGKLQMAAMSRAESSDLGQFPPFYVYIDEFQNVTTDSITSILSEARKYKLSLNLTHQYLEQLPENIKGAIFGNVGSMAFFRIKSEDAAYVEPRVVPQFTKDDIVKQDNFNAIVSMLVNGRPARAFNMNTTYDGFAPQGKPELIQHMKELSYLTYGRDRAEVEQEIMKRYERRP